MKLNCKNESFNWLMEEKNIDIISKYNFLLKPIEELLTNTISRNYPPIFIVGTPRSGTTFLYQYLASVTNLGYINNFIARFWEVPTLGFYLNNFYSIDKEISFKSELGKTKNIGDVHEFGFFWKRFFNDNENDAADFFSNQHRFTLKKEVNQISNIVKNNIVFKNLTCGLRLKKLKNIFPNMKVIFIKRDNIDLQAISIFRARMKYNNSYEQWWSLKPENIKELQKIPVEKQIYHQIVDTNQLIAKNIEELDIANLKITLEDFISSTSLIANKIRRFLKVSFLKNNDIQNQIIKSNKNYNSIEKDFLESFRRLL